MLLYESRLSGIPFSTCIRSLLWPDWAWLGLMGLWQNSSHTNKRWEEPSRKKNLQACGKLRKEKDRGEREREVGSTTADILLNSL